MNATPTMQWTIHDPTDDSPYSSRLRAVWLVGVSEPPPRYAPEEDGWDDIALDLVDVTPAFAWVS
jgi:hypothetical protein